MRRLLLIVAVLAAPPAALPVEAQAQDAVYLGRVRSATLQSVRGAHVSIAGLDLSTVTNDAGRYQLTVPSAQVRGQQVTIAVQMIGYETGEVTVTVTPGVHAYDITLREAAIALDEVIVTGTIGRQERRAQAAVVAQVDAAQLTEVAPVASVTSMLQARVPGVSINQSSGSAGTASDIFIRGLASVELSNQPLVFIDGVRADDRQSQIYSVLGQSGSRLNDIRPEDIESIEVVKGPAAATLYGADASAGVIQIITKKGRTGGGFSQTLSMEYASIDPNFRPPDNWGACRERHIEDPERILCQGKQPGDLVSDNPLVRYDVFNTVNGQSLGYTLRGGGTNYGIFLSFGRDQEDGTLPSNAYARTSGRLNVDFMPHEKVRIEAGFGLIRAYTRLPHNDNSIYGYMGGGYLGSPLTVGKAQDGWYAPNRQLDALASMENEDVSYRIQPRLALSYSPVDWFTNRLTVGGDLTRTEARQFWPKNEVGWFASDDLNRGQIGEARQVVNRLTFDYLGNFRRTLSAFATADVSIGFQALLNQFDLTSATGIGLSNNAANAVSAAAETTGGQTFSENRTYGLFGQVQFGLWERLYFQIAGRIDEHSAFGVESDAFFSPKAGISYVVSDEAFWDDVFGDWISTLRVRAAYGTTGRSPSSGALATYEPTPYAIVPGGIEQGIVPGNPGNPELRPERGTEYEAGFEAGFLGDRVGLEVTYFNKKTTDLILERPLPPSMAYEDDPFVNIGEVLNRGFEIALNAQLVTRQNFGWQVMASMSTLENRILDLGDIAPFGTIRPGFPIQGHFSHRIRRVDVENDVTIVSDTLEFVGNSLPGREATLASTINFLSGFSLYAQVDYRGDVWKYRSGDQFRDRQFRNSEAWHRRDDPAFMPAEERLRLFGPFRTESGDPIGFGSVTEGYIHRSDFARLREVSLSYRIPRDFASRYLHVNGATLTVAGRNLALWTDYPGDDPESRYGIASEFFTVPIDRRLIARVTVQF